MRLNGERFEPSTEGEFIRLYKDLYKSMVSYGVRICGNEDLARDSIHEVFLEIWEKYDKLSGVKDMKPYLFRCLRNVLVDNFKKQPSFLRDETGKFSCLNDSLNEEKHFSLSHEDLIIEKESVDESRQLMAKFINQLTARQKEVFYLKFYDGLSNRQISEITGIHYQSVRNILSEGIRRIRELNLEFYLYFIGGMITSFS